MKKLDRHTFFSFIGPFAVSLLVILFILVMQFMALYLNDIASRQPSPDIIGKLFFYASGRLVLTAMPVALLAGALMAFGNLGEFNELAAMKSCGISLLKIMRSVVAFTALLTLVSLWVSFDVIPKANLKFFSLLYDVQRKKPDLAIKPGHFYSDIDGYVIRVSDKNPDSGTLFDVMIYNHTENRGNNDIIIADSARMKTKGGTLSMVLYEGVRYEEYKPESGEQENRPHGRTYFDSLYYRFPLEGFELSRTDESLFRHQITLPYRELVNAIDSIDALEGKQLIKNTQQLSRYNKIDTAFMVYTKDTMPVKKTVVTYDMDSDETILECYDNDYPDDIVSRAITNARAIKSYVEFMSKKRADQKQAERKYDFEFYFRYALPFNCLVFVLIGIALGAIIRKGGLGMPALISLGFFMAFYVLTTQGKKLAKEDVLDPFVGAWLSVIIFGPVALALVYQATMDAKLLSESYWGMVRDKWPGLAYILRRIPGIGAVLYAVELEEKQENMEESLDELGDLMDDVGSGVQRLFRRKKK
ncbi:MAG: LptF/LptG family permease [Bacteroidota bacterium]